jgi:signal transduction histidine kinase
LASRNELDVNKRQEYLEMAKVELDRLMQTVQRMLELFRPSGLDPVQLDVGHLIRRVVELMSPQLDARKIRVTLGISSKLPKITAVGSQLQQVFINLILNAYDAMPDGGEIRVTARLAKDMVEMLFQDTGPGISPEYRNRIFEPFMSTKDKGIGLGLSVSYGIVVAHGGSLDLIPDRGTGACFRVLLPARKDEKKS